MGGWRAVIKMNLELYLEALRREIEIEIEREGAYHGHGKNTFLDNDIILRTDEEEGFMKVEYGSSK